MAKGEISSLVWLYVKRRPFLKEFLRERIVNYSALARKISIDAFGSEESVGAVKASLQRISQKLAEKEGDLEEKTFRVLRGSSVTVQNKVAVVISYSALPSLKPISYAKSEGHYTYIISESELAKTKKAKGVEKVEETLNLITIHSGEEIEETPGVIASVLSLLSSEGINVVEFISCYTDTLLVVKEADTAKAYELLSFIMK